MVAQFLQISRLEAITLTASNLSFYSLSCSSAQLCFILFLGELRV